MKIIIEYESSWRNSFLDGSNDEQLPKQGRNFVASSAKLKDSTNFHQREITQNTVMGILNRLIGDQRKLYQSRQSEDYYFADMENLIHFQDIPKIQSNEVVYLRNIEGSDDKKGYMGMINANHPIFKSEYSFEFWNVLSLNIEQLCEFILRDKLIKDFELEKTLPLDPLSILGQLEVPSDNIALDKIVKSCFNIEFDIKNIVSKDSLDFTQEDREIILENIINSENNKIIIIHGTDTVDLTTKFIEDKIENKKVVFTGAMIPMSIDEVEATMNFSQAIGFLNAPIKNGIYLSMHGSVIEHSKLKKDRSVGQFLVKN